MTEKKRILVTGAGGFIGHHLVKHLKEKGHWVRGADIKNPEFEPTQADEFHQVDLRHFEKCAQVATDIDDVYHLAADMGGIGYITDTFAQLTRNNALISAHMLEAARLDDVDRYLFTSSACIYPHYKQNDADVEDLKEEDAFPAEPEKGYGWEKLFTEQLTTYYNEDHGLDTRLIRFHNIYGPLGAYQGGKEKAPAALMRKVACAEDGSSIEVWGDGEQTRSFCHVDDCVEGIYRIMESGYTEPLNLGTEELVTINELVDIIAEASGKNIHKNHDLSKPQGVRGRNSDNSRLKDIIGWEPQIKLREGIAKTYPWIWSEMNKKNLAKDPKPQKIAPISR